MDDFAARGLSDLENWNHWVEEIKNQDDLSADIKEAALVGLGELRRYFGEGWPAEAVQDKHPMLLILIQRAAWARSLIAEIGDKLAVLEHVPGFSFLLVRLKQSREFVGALAELYIAWRLHARGLSIALSPKVEERSPDISIAGNPTIFIEVAVSRLSDIREKTERVMRNLGVLSIMDPGVAVGGQIHQVLPDGLAAEIYDQMKDAINRVKATGLPTQIHRPGLADFHFAPRADELVVGEWIREGKVNHIVGPLLEPAEVTRLLRVLRDKIRQLPESGAGIVLIYDSYASLETSRENLVAEISETIYKHPKITAAMIVTRRLALSREGGSIYVDTEFGLTLSQRVNPFFEEELLAVRNASAMHPMDSQRILGFFHAPLYRFR